MSLSSRRHRILTAACKLKAAGTTRFVTLTGSASQKPEKRNVRLVILINAKMVIASSIIQSNIMFNLVVNGDSI